MSDTNVTRIPDADLRKTRRSAFLRVIGSFLGLILLSGAILAAAGAYMYSVYSAAGPLQAATVVDVQPQMSSAEISSLLKDKGVISDATVMSLAAAVQSLRGGKLKPGEYEFPAGATMAEVYNIIALGRVVTYKLTVPEGWTSEMAVARLRENDVLTGDIATVPPEGAIIANTYLFARGRSRADLLQEMIAAQSKLVDEVWAMRKPDSIITTKEQMLTLASIVEKETAKPDERPRVAAVFLNRLKSGMRLQSDPTIIYGLVGGKGKLDRPITKDDIASETPYNTYRIVGLPPGPIATPGKDALIAVMNPAVSSDLFFVADGTGGHVFAATLEEHNANVKKWRALEEQGEAGTAPATPDANVVETAEPIASPPAQLPNVAEEEADAAAKAEAEANAAIEKAASDADQTAKVPEPGAAEEPATVAPVTDAPAAPAVLKPATPDPAASEEIAVKTESKSLKPGTVVKVNGKLVPIPALKKKP